MCSKDGQLMQRSIPPDNHRCSALALIQRRLGLDDCRLSEEEQQKCERVQKAAKKEQASAYALTSLKNSKLVNVESFPSRFLQASRGDETLAAIRLSAQWEYRRKVLGDEHYRRPLTMTGSKRSALSETDANIFHLGFLAILSSDTSGRPVLCYDSCRLEQDYSRDDLNKLKSSVRRCLFYTLSVLSENPATAAEGITLLMLYNSSFQFGPFEVSFQEMVRECINAFPVASSRVEVACRPPRRNNAEYVENIVPQLYSNIQRCHEGSECNLTCFSYTDRLFNALKDRGFQKEGLPMSVGGSWTPHREFGEWYRERKITDEVKEAYVTIGDEAMAMTVASNVLRQGAVQKRKREQDQEYARRKRERSQQTVLQLQEQAQNLRLQNSFLKQEGERLSQLLADVSRTVTVLESSPRVLSSPLQSSLPRDLTRQHESQMQRLMALQYSQAHRNVLDANQQLALLENVNAQRRRIDIQRSGLSPALNLPVPFASNASLGRLSVPNLDLQLALQADATRQLGLPLGLNSLTPQAGAFSLAHIAQMNQIAPINPLNTERLRVHPSTALHSAAGHNNSSPDRYLATDRFREAPSADVLLAMILREQSRHQRP